MAFENGFVVFLVKTAIDSALAPVGRATAVIANAIRTGIGRFMVSLPWVGNVGSISLGCAHGDGGCISSQDQHGGVRSMAMRERLLDHLWKAVINVHLRHQALDN